MTDAGRPLRPGHVRSSSAAAWLLSAFLSVWLDARDRALLVLFAYSFFESRKFAMIYKPSLATWKVSSPRGASKSPCARCALR